MSLLIFSENRGLSLIHSPLSGTNFLRHRFLLPPAVGRGPKKASVSERVTERAPSDGVDKGRRAARRKSNADALKSGAQEPPNYSVKVISSKVRRHNPPPERGRTPPRCYVWRVWGRNVKTSGQERRTSGFKPPSRLWWTSALTDYPYNPPRGRAVPSGRNVSGFPGVEIKYDFKGQKNVEDKCLRGGVGSPGAHEFGENPEVVNPEMRGFFGFTQPV